MHFLYLSLGIKDVIKQFEQVDACPRVCLKSF